MQTPLSADQIDQLRSLDTCLVADAIESFGVRLRNEGFPRAAFRCLCKALPPMVGFAATCKVRSADPPIVGRRYEERPDWWKRLADAPYPRVLVMQDLDDPPGTGAFLGKVHASILKALGCAGAVTNGSARELAGIEASGFQVFAGGVSISRAYIHVVEYGEPVEIGCLTIRPGDLIHGDRHGIITIPPELVARIPAVAAAIAKKKQHIIDLTQQTGITPEEFGREIKELLDFDPQSIGDGVKE